ncbi:hypothetical protein E6Q11_03215 [Candidatus Dojkabacteria bacterium]|uniref:Uncharacterized protein n=1 Tax=Candidatus Dojkabacteria bacterium TaxID=2099670 RepID=A0A5C7J8E9_9BACT|nr:MAG: hypothetical protein E6Q11_03215 [Candidatus Dojkabacteria bacterium]
MNINFQNGKGTVIAFEDKELLHVHIMLQALVGSGMVSGDAKEKILRIILQMQAHLFKRREEEEARKRFKICEKCACEIDLKLQEHCFVNGGYIHLICPELKEDRP